MKKNLSKPATTFELYLYLGIIVIAFVWGILMFSNINNMETEKIKLQSDSLKTELKVIKAEIEILKSIKPEKCDTVIINLNLQK